MPAASTATVARKANGMDKRFGEGDGIDVSSWDGGPLADMSAMLVEASKNRGSGRALRTAIELQRMSCTKN